MIDTVSPYVGIRRCKRGVFMYLTHDTFVGHSLHNYGEWCDSEISLAEQVIRPGDTVIDVGANIGTHTVAFAQLVGNNGRVMAYEPQMPLYHMLCGNVALNFLSHQTWTYPYIAGNKAGRHFILPMPLPVFPMNYAAISLKRPNPAGVAVPIVPIDQLQVQACKLIKIDVERMETDVLHGATETIKRCRPYLFVENNSIDGAFDINRTIFEFNYRAYWKISPYYNPHNHFGNPVNIWPNVQPEANLICVPNENTSWTPDLPECVDPHDNWEKAWSRGRDLNPRFPA